MKMKSKYYFMVALCALCHIQLLRAQSSNNSTGFMSHVNSWISRLRGNHNNNNNNNNNNQNNSDKDKESDDKKNQQSRPMAYPGIIPYPMMPGMYGPMAPMPIHFAPRPMPAASYGPAMPFGSLTAGSSMGPSLGSSIGSSLGSNMGPGLSASIPMGPSFGQLSPSFSSASHVMPVHHDYHETNQDYHPVRYGIGSSFGNSFSGLSGNNFGSLRGGQPVDEQMVDNSFNGEQAEHSNAEEYSGYQR